MDTEQEQLTKYPENRENFELEIDPKLYVKDKYYYRNRRIKTAVWVVCGVLSMSLIVLLTVFFITNHKSSPTDLSQPTLEAQEYYKETPNATLPIVETTTLTTTTTTNKSTIGQTSTITTSTSTEDAQNVEERRQFVVKMAYEAWDKYERHAWGQDALRPLTKDYSWHQFGLNSGLSIVTSMSTLWIMGMEDEFALGKNWIEHQLNLSRIAQHINVQPTVTEYIGSLLSCYALTKDKLFLNKANEIAQMLKPAYNHTSGMSYMNVIPKSGTVGITTPSLASIGGQHLEYIYLSDMTNDVQYRKLMEKTRTFLQTIDKPKGLYLKKMYVETDEWLTDVSTLAKPGGDFYFYLIKSYIQSGGKDQQAMEMYKEAMDAIDSNKMFATSKTGLVYARNYHPNESKYSDYMNSDSCYLGAMLALGANALEQALAQNKLTDVVKAKVEIERIDRHWKLADQLTETCHQAANRSKTGLPPHHFYFTHKDEATNTATHKYKEYHLSFELMESYFTLWRLTHDSKYREYAWELAEAIHAHCRTENGYSNIQDATRVPTQKTNYQDAQFMGATLKYLYLIFSEDDAFPLDRWVFNAFGQPLPICGTNHHYPVDKCIDHD